MPERNHEVVIDGYVFPDTVTVTLANDEYINSRDYVSKELYESVDGANDVWQAENAKLREDVAETALMLGAAWEHCSKLRELCADIYEMAYHEYPSAFEAAFADRMRELGVEVP